jgi:hypothetical protein
MTTALKTALLSAFLLSGASRAFAEAANPTLTHDPLMKKIMNCELTLPGGGRTGAVRLGSGEAIPLILVNPLSPSEPLKDAVADPEALTGLKPAKGLAAKAVKAAPRRKFHNDSALLKKMAADKHHADWPGRK